MLKIIRRRELKERISYSRDYEWTDCPGAGFGFPCNEKGIVRLAEMTDEARANYFQCANGTMTNQAGAGVVFKGVRKSVSRWWEPTLAECICGHIIELAAFTNTCVNCNRDYNQAGQLLAPRSQWGEETGETPDEILNIGHHTS